MELPCALRPQERRLQTNTRAFSAAFASFAVFLASGLIHEFLNYTVEMYHMEVLVCRAIFPGKISLGKRRYSIYHHNDILSSEQPNEEHSSQE